MRVLVERDYKRVTEVVKTPGITIGRLNVENIQISMTENGDVSFYITKEGQMCHTRLVHILNKEDHNNSFCIKVRKSEEYFYNPKEFFVKYEEMLKQTNETGFAYEIVGALIKIRQEHEVENDGIDLTIVFKPL